MNDNKPDLSNIKKILLRNRRDLHNETKLYLAKELKTMAELNGEYRIFDKVATSLMQEIWFMAACYLEDEV